MGQSITRLVILTRVFCVGLLLCKYPYRSIVKHFALVIQKYCNKLYRLGYNVD